MTALARLLAEDGTLAPEMKQNDQAQLNIPTAAGIVASVQNRATERALKEHVSNKPIEQCTAK